MKKGLVLLVTAVLVAACASTSKKSSRIEMDNLLPLDQTCTLEVQEGIIITQFNGDRDAFRQTDFWGAYTTITRVPAGKGDLSIRYAIRSDYGSYPYDKWFHQEFLPGHTYRIYYSFGEAKIKDMGAR